MPLFCKTVVFLIPFFAKIIFHCINFAYCQKLDFISRKIILQRFFGKRKLKKKLGKNTFSLVATPQGEFSPHTYIQLKVEVLAILLHYSCFSLCQLVISVFCSCHLYLSITNKCLSHIYCKYVHTVV